MCEELEDTEYKISDTDIAQDKLREFREQNGLVADCSTPYAFSRVVNN